MKRTYCILLLAVSLIFGCSGDDTTDDVTPEIPVTRIFFSSFKLASGNVNVGVHSVDLESGSVDDVFKKSFAFDNLDYYIFGGMATHRDLPFVVVADLNWRRIYKISKSGPNQMETWFDEDDDLPDLGHYMLMDKEGNYVYWLQKENSQIARAAVAGDKLEIVASVPDPGDGAYIGGFALNEKSQMAYVAVVNKGIYQVGFDGKNGKYIHTFSDDEQRRYSGMAYDPTSDRIFLLDVEGFIGYLPASGSGELKLLYQNIEESYGLQLDPVNRKFFWCGDESTFAILSADIDQVSAVKELAENSGSRSLALQ